MISYVRSWCHLRGEVLSLFLLFIMEGGETLQEKDKEREIFERYRLQPSDSQYFVKDRIIRNLFCRSTSFLQALFLRTLPSATDLARLAHKVSRKEKRHGVAELSFTVEHFCALRWIFYNDEEKRRTERRRNEKRFVKTAWGVSSSVYLSSKIITRARVGKLSFALLVSLLSLACVFLCLMLFADTVTTMVSRCFVLIPFPLSLLPRCNKVALTLID